MPSGDDAAEGGGVTLRDGIEEIMLNAIRYRSDNPIQLEGEAGRKLAAEDRAWLLRYIDRHKLAPQSGERRRSTA
jgi:hypothetical protein